MGYGDSIMVTGFARLAKEKYPNLQIVIGDKESSNIANSIIFKNNPNITNPKEIDPSINKVWIENYPGKRPYIKYVDDKKYYWNPNYRPVKGDLFFDEKEKNLAYSIFEKIKEKYLSKFNNKNKKIIFIEPSRKEKNYKDPNLLNTQGEYNRDWGKDNWNKFIKLYNDRVFFVQSLHENSDYFDEIYTFKSDFRNACAVLQHCDTFIGWEGGFSHAAAALNKKAVVLFGGWIHPNTIGYKFHSNIYIDIEGSPCGMRNKCQHCNECRNRIKVEDVGKKLEETLFKSNHIKI